MPAWISNYTTSKVTTRPVRSCMILSINYEIHTSIVITHWDGMTDICFSNRAMFGSDNGLVPGWRQAIIWSNAGILLIAPLWTNFSEMLIEYIFIYLSIYSYKKMHLKRSSGKWNPFCLGHHVLRLMNVSKKAPGNPVFFITTMSPIQFHFMVLCNDRNPTCLFKIIKDN